MFSIHAILCAAAAALTLPATLTAQLVGGQWDTPHQIDGAVSNKMGTAVASVGDVDGDGFDDVLVSAPGASPGGVFKAGSVFIYSGATGAVISQFHGAAVGDSIGSSLSTAGDVDGDGIADLIVGAEWANPGGQTSAGSVFVFSGATGATIWEYHGVTPWGWLGISVSDTGDLNGDGFDDFMFAEFYGGAFVYSGATGTLLWQFNSSCRSVSGIEDVNGDGVPDLIVGDNAASPGGLTSAGSAFVYSGATGILLHQFDGAAAGDQFGFSVSGIEDVDGDGVADLIVGAIYTDPGVLINAGTAYVYSGASGALIWQFDALTSYEEFGYSVSGAGDVNGDGVEDLIVGAPIAAGNVGSAYVYSGATGGLLVKFVESGASRFGLAVSGAGDTDGDGLADVLVGAPESWPGGVNDAGSAYIFSLDPYLHPDSGSLSVSGGSTAQLGVGCFLHRLLRIVRKFPR